jgi:tRNA dimethylallyltransferase
VSVPVKKHTLIVVVGPTAVGKTAVAIQLARHFQTEIVSADSRQIFRELTIGTAKPGEAELTAIRHHFIDSHSIHQQYDAAQYGEDALQCIQALFQKFPVVILCGGSGLYVKAVLEGFDDIPPVAPEVRESLTRNFEEKGLPWLQEQLRMLDPQVYAKIDQQNPQRMIRALEVKIGTGLSISAFHKQQPREHAFAIIKIGLELPRETLYHRIDVRMDMMISEGLFDEAKAMYAYKHYNALQTVGYQEIFDYLDGMYDREEAIRLLKRNSRRYAKRQLTWFRRDAETQWFNPAAVEDIIHFIEEKISAINS